MGGIAGHIRDMEKMRLVALIPNPLAGSAGDASPQSYGLINIQDVNGLIKGREKRDILISAAGRYSNENDPARAAFSQECAGFESALRWFKCRLSSCFVVLCCVLMGARLNSRMTARQAPLTPHLTRLRRELLRRRPQLGPTSWAAMEPIIDKIVFGRKNVILRGFYRESIKETCIFNKSLNR